MPNLLHYLYATGAFQGILLGGLLICSRQVANASRILGVWSLLLALNFLGIFIYMNGELNAFSSFIGYSAFLPACYGTLLYLYCRHALVDRALRLKDLWHFTPILLCYLLNIDLFLATPSEKLHFIFNGPLSGIRFHVSEVIIYLQAFVYLGLSILLIKRAQNKAENTLSNYNPTIFPWLWTMLALYFVIWTLKTLAQYVYQGVMLSPIADGLIVVFIYSIAMAQWRDPKLFKIEQLKTDIHGENSSNFTNSGQSEQANNSQSYKEVSKKTTGALNASIRASLLTVVQQHMQDHQAFLDNQLTLTRFSEATKISTHHLSEVLNQHQGKNFYQFVNEYRINYICEILQKDQQTRILDIALSAGFSSKSTFNAVFKQFKKLTPSQYRQQLLTK